MISAMEDVRRRLREGNLPDALLAPATGRVAGLKRIEVGHTANAVCARKDQLAAPLVVGGVGYTDRCGALGERRATTPPEPRRGGMRVAIAPFQGSGDLAEDPAFPGRCPGLSPAAPSGLPD